MMNNEGDLSGIGVAKEDNGISGSDVDNPETQREVRGEQFNQLADIPYAVSSEGLEDLNSPAGNCTDHHGE